MPGEPEHFASSAVTNGIRAVERRRKLSNSSLRDRILIPKKKRKPPLHASHTQLNGDYSKLKAAKKRIDKLDQTSADQDNDTSTNPPSLDDGTTSRESSTPNTPKSFPYIPSTAYDENPEDLLDSTPSDQVTEPVTPRHCGIQLCTAVQHGHARNPTRRSIPNGDTLWHFHMLRPAAISQLRDMDPSTGRVEMRNSSPGQDPGSFIANADVASNGDSGVPDSTLPTIPAAAMGSGNPSTEDSESTTSQKARVNHCDDELEDDGGLKSLIKNNTAGPKVAKELFERVCGKLEYAPQQRIHSLEDTELFSLLDALELDICYYGCANSGDRGSKASSSSPTSSAVGGSSPAPNKHPGGSGNLPGNGANGSSNDNFTEITESTEVVNAETRSRPGKADFLFRCPHHAYLPELFRVNHGTSRYRSCMGPGWNSIHHLRGHMKSHHKTKAKKEKVLRCSDCQEVFEGKTELKDHKENVTCVIRCSECQQEFSCREERMSHYSEAHEKQTDQSPYREIDDDLETKIMTSLKTYADGLKKGKETIDDERERWITANTEKYMRGRDDNANPWLELGQWYIIFTTLFPQIQVPEPFYAYDDGIPNSEYVQERILFLFDQGVESHIKYHGQPEATHEATKGFYSNILRQSLNIAANTRLLAGSSSHESHNGQFQESIKDLDHSPQAGTVTGMPIAPTSHSAQPQQHDMPPARIQSQLGLVQNDGFGGQLMTFGDDSQTFLDGTQVLLDGEFNGMDFISLGNDNDLIINDDLNVDNPFNGP